MTKPVRSSFVLDGSDVKHRLEAERKTSGNVVHVDWVRFTTLLRNAPYIALDAMFPVHKDTNIWSSEYRENELKRVLKECPDPDFAAAGQAHELALKVAECLGTMFLVQPEIKKGHDFYKYRWSITRNDQECGWVGFLSSGDSPRQSAQSKTLHANVYGSACTFAQEGWNLKLADLIDSCDGDITRADLAVDFFDGFVGGMEGVKSDYMAGLCNSGGKQLKCNLLGDWCNGQERSFYMGSKEAGKQTNIYEKGDQLFGPSFNSSWLRVELRYGNKLRFLSTELLRRPDDFFAGASEWHADKLQQLRDNVIAELVKTTPRLAVETVKAEVTRNVKWVINNAGPSLAAAWEFLGDSEFLMLVAEQKKPGRLAKFAKSELAQAYGSVMGMFSQAGGHSPLAA